jgi:hypothetical protein
VNVAGVGPPGVTSDDGDDDGEDGGAGGAEPVRPGPADAQPVHSKTASTRDPIFDIAPA